MANAGAHTGCSQPRHPRFGADCFSACRFRASSRASARTLAANIAPARTSIERSEEHTSELQSHSDLVCRLLLEKKKQYSARHCIATALHNYEHLTLSNGDGSRIGSRSTSTEPVLMLPTSAHGSRCRSLVG